MQGHDAKYPDLEFAIYSSFTAELDYHFHLCRHHNRTILILPLVSGNNCDMFSQALKTIWFEYLDTMARGSFEGFRES